MPMLQNVDDILFYQEIRAPVTVRTTAAGFCASSQTATSAALIWGRLMTGLMSPASATSFFSLSMRSCGRR